MQCIDAVNVMTTSEFNCSANCFIANGNGFCASEILPIELECLSLLMERRFRQQFKSHKLAGDELAGLIVEEFERPSMRVVVAKKCGNEDVCI